MPWVWSYGFLQPVVLDRLGVTAKGETWRGFGEGRGGREQKKESQGRCPTMVRARCHAEI